MASLNNLCSSQESPSTARQVPMRKLIRCKCTAACPPQALLFLICCRGLCQKHRYRTRMPISCTMYITAHLMLGKGLIREPLQLV